MQLNLGVRRIPRFSFRTLVLKAVFVVGLAFLAACAREVTDKNIRDTVRAPRHWPGDPLKTQVHVPPLADSAARAAVVACTSSDPVLTPSQVGPIRVTQTLDEVFLACPGALPAWDLGDEAIPEPAALIRLSNTLVEVVFADTLSGSRVSRILIEDPTARFASGPAVGGDLETFAKTFGPVQVEEIECSLHAYFPRTPGISVLLQLPHDLDCTRLKALADSVVDGTLRRGVRAARISLFAPSA